MSSYSSLFNHFRLTGYVLLKEMVSAHLLAEVTRSTSDLGRDVRIDNAISALGLESFLKSEAKTVEALKAMLGTNVVIVKNRHNHVTITTSPTMRAHRIHADSKASTFDYVTLLIPICGFDRSMAWPQLVPGSHLSGPTGPDNGGGRWLDEAGDQGLMDQLVGVPLRPGDVLLMDPRVYHRAGYGARGRPRTMLTLAVAGSNELLPEPQPNHLQWFGDHNYTGHRFWQGE